MEGLPHAHRGQRDYLNALLYSVQSPPILDEAMGTLDLEPMAVP